MARTIAKDHQEKREALLKTAAVFFAENGFDRASMNDLARAAGVSKALLYHYFSKKEAILFAILQTHLSALVDAVAATDTAADTPRGRLRALIHAIIDAYDGADAEHRLQLEAMGALPPEQQEELAKLQRKLVSEMSQYLQAVTPDARLKDRATNRALTMSVFGILNWMYLWYRPDGGLSRSDYADLVADLVLDGIAAPDSSGR